jgi:hypothetical protein
MGSVGSACLHTFRADAVTASRYVTGPALVLPVGLAVSKHTASCFLT